MKTAELHEPEALSLDAWLDLQLQGEGVTDLCINGCHHVHRDRGRGMEAVAIPESAVFWNDAALKHWVVRQLAAVDRTWDARFPFTDFVMARGFGDFRVHVAFAPMCSHGILISIRKLSRPSAGTHENGELARDQRRLRWGNGASGVSTGGLYDRLVHAVERGESMLIVGATGSGKTTLANDLLSAVPGNERIIALEDTPELQPEHPHFLSLVSRPANADGHGEVGLRDLLKQTLRMRPDRIVLGECRGAEVLDFLQILNTGHRGGMATLHAHSSRDALRRLELLCHLHDRAPLAVHVVRELIAAGLRYIVHVERGSGGRAIESVQELAGLEGSTVLLRPLVRSAV